MEVIAPDRAYLKYIRHPSLGLHRVQMETKISWTFVSSRKPFLCYLVEIGLFINTANRMTVQMVDFMSTGSYSIEVATATAG